MFVLEFCCVLFFNFFQTEIDPTGEPPPCRANYGMYGNIFYQEMFSSDTGDILCGPRLTLCRLVQMESVLEEQRILMRRMIKHNGNLRSLWRKYAAAPIEDRYILFR